MFMNRNLFLIFACLGALALAACGGKDANTTPNNNGAGNANVSRANTNGPIAAHNAPGGPPASTQPAGNPGPGPTGDPIDATKLDADIDKAEKAHAAKPNDVKTTKALGDAYLARAQALTEARQYRAALGDYRKTLKYDPTNEEATSMSNQIISIMQQMGREVPAEGQEPPAMRK
jgi:tetratricopeptide (TPR) repeat protein